MMTSHGNKVTLPQMDGKDDEGVYVGAEPQKRTEGDLITNLQLPAISDLEWNAYLCNSKRMRVRRETVDDVVFDVIGRVIMHIHRRIGRVGNRKYTRSAPARTSRRGS